MQATAPKNLAPQPGAAREGAGSAPELSPRVPGMGRGRRGTLFWGAVDALCVLRVGKQIKSRQEELNPEVCQCS